MGATERPQGLSDASGGLAARADVARSALIVFPLDRAGATAIEYAVVASLISIVIVAAVTGIGTQLSSFFTTLAPHL